MRASSPPLLEPTIAPPDQEPGRIEAAAIVEAQGWVMGADGAVRLIATAPAGAVPPPPTCHRPKNE
ncbi:hypothetical protein [Nostoc sp. CHAB 5715]|uniref:hypothetical protein n=1 Tax=Nostoc sp. CHAB 5715 TaxID=2780400 RepID=UPI001E54709A|nr:hypothetical protein [Nostoc sp. CHAB 5715]MCC5619932.1 hypothetical protein [Nostoc sp. CHAB 5715]